jgi:hypothetical protein
VATNHNFRVKNGLEVGGVEVVNSSGVLQLASTLTSTTQNSGTNNTTLATTAFVTAAVAAIGDGHIDWTGASAGTIHASNYTNTTYSVGDGGLTTNDFTNADHSKLNAIEASATADQTDAEIRAAVEAATNSNVFTDADHSKLNAIEASATADQTDAEIRAAVEAASDSNVFTDADHSKLNAIEASADVTDTANVVAALSAGTGVAISGGGAISVTAVALTTVQTAANQSAHLALTAQEGDIVVRSDENKTYCHNGGSAGTMNDYTLLATPTDAVLSVAGNTGAVSAAQIAAAVEAASNSNTFTDADHSKLGAIEASATADQTDAEIRTAVEAASDSNVFTDADHSKLNAVEANADVTDTTNVVAALTAGTNVAIAANGTISSTDTTYSVGDGGLTTNDFTNADHSKLNAIEASADVTDTANVTSAGALMDSELTSIASVKALNQGVATGNSPTFAALTITGAITSAAKAVGTQTVTATAPSSATGFPNGHVWYVV